MKPCISVLRHWRARLLAIFLVPVLIASCGGGGSSGGSTGENSLPVLQLDDGQVFDAGNSVITIPAGDDSGIASVVAVPLRQGNLQECQGQFGDVPVANSLIEACLADQPTCAVDFLPGDNEITVFPPPLFAPIGLEYELSLVDRDGEATDPVAAVFCLDVGVNFPPQPANDTYQVVFPNVLQQAGVVFDAPCFAQRASKTTPAC